MTMRSSFATIGIAVSLLLLCGAAESAEPPAITWPSGWQVEALPQDPGAQSATVSRQRAVKNDATGSPVMVMELTMSQVETGHQVNLQGVLLEMRKAVQKDFVRGGYQSVCTRIHETSLSRLTALETTCTITQNGRHVLSQTLVTAVDADKAYVLSYAGQAQVYADSQNEINSVRNSLKL